MSDWSWNVPVITVLMLFAVPAAAVPVQREVYRYAVLIGAPHANGSGQADLEYADDDVVHLALFLRAAGVATHVLTLPSGTETHGWPQWPEFAHLPDIPTLDSVKSALGGAIAYARERRREIEQEVRCKPGSGKEPNDCPTVELLLYFSGHADDGMLFLQDQALTGELLRQELLAPAFGPDVRANAVHVLIDACSVGGVPGLRQASRFVRDLRPGDYPKLGLFLGRTRAGTTLQWPQWRAGVLSFLIRSGLAGAADVVGPEADASQRVLTAMEQRMIDPELSADGGVGYTELGAFVKAATHNVPNETSRILPVHTRRNFDFPIVDWESTGPPGPGTYYELSFPNQAIRVRILDKDGLPLIETHYGESSVTGSRGFKLRLPPRGGTFYIQVVEKRGEKWASVRQGVWRPGESDPVQQDFSAIVLTNTQTKGAHDDLEHGLFAYQFSDRTLGGYRPTEPLETATSVSPKGIHTPVLDPSSNVVSEDSKRQFEQGPNPWIVGSLCAATVLSGGAALFSHLRAESAYDDWRQASNEVEYRNVGRRYEQWTTVRTITLLTAAGAGLGCGGVLLFGGTSQSDVNARVELTPFSGAITGSF